MFNKSIRDYYGYNCRVRDVLTPYDIKDLKNNLKKLKNLNFKFKVLGNLSNVLLASKKSELVVLKLAQGFFNNIEVRNGLVESGAGVGIKRLLNFCIRKSLSGLEFLIGIPGTVGGSVVGNCGAFGKAISDFIFQIDCLNYNAESTILARKDLEFKYRWSNLKNCVVTKVYFKLYDSSLNLIKQKMNFYFSKRLKSQEYILPSCGCFFKNNSRFKAKDIIEELELSGRRRGSALVSFKHSNFLTASQARSPEDILALKDIIQRNVWLKKKVWLYPEVEVLW